MDVVSAWSVLMPDEPVLGDQMTEWHAVKSRLGAEGNGMPRHATEEPAGKRKSKRRRSGAPNFDPPRQAFLVQRHQAGLRKIEWQLEYWEWLQIWQDSGHLHERGKRHGEWVMARKGDIGPYSAENVKIVRCETNNSQGQIAKSRYRQLRAES